jgi:dimethylamine/trimethylamine dehydrogenase
MTHLPIPGVLDEVDVLTPEDIAVAHKRPRGPQVIVYDTDGYFMGPALAEKLRGEGHEVKLVTPFDRVSPFSDDTLEGYMLRGRLLELGVETITASQIDAFIAGDAVLRGPAGVSHMRCDTAVLVNQRFSKDSLYRSLRDSPADLGIAEIRAVYRIGDCVAPMLYVDAIFDGHRLAREIDSGNPEVPLPPVRERFGTRV